MLDTCTPKPNEIPISPEIEEKEMSDVASDIGKETVEDIKVCLRLRPLNKRERDPKVWGASGEYAWKQYPQSNSMIQVQGNGSAVGREDRKSGRTVFTFDKVFEDNDTTEYVYSFAGKELVQSCVEGRNGSIFAYGQTSSGKTHTMQGDGSIRDGMIKEKPGIIHLVAKDLFQEAELVKDRDFVFNVSVIEVYNEEVRDLLSKAKDNRLGIREDTALGVFVNATRVEASSVKKLIACLSAGEKNRAVARTTLNKRSSRSHIIFSINIESFPVDDISGGAGYGRISTLNLIDLAGSESVRHRSSHSTEMRRKEGGSINKR
jgi:centromeric protein E